MAKISHDAFSLTGKDVMFTDTTGKEREGTVVEWIKYFNTYVIKCKDGKILRDVLITDVEEKEGPTGTIRYLQKWYYLRTDEREPATFSGRACGKCGVCLRDGKSCLVERAKWLATRKIYCGLVCEMGTKAIGGRVQVLWHNASPPMWYTGTVTEYDEKTVRHQIIFDDGDITYCSFTELLIAPCAEENLELMNSWWRGQEWKDVERDVCFGSRTVGTSVVEDKDECYVYTREWTREATPIKWEAEKTTHLVRVKSREILLNLNKHVLIRFPKNPQFRLRLAALEVDDRPRQQRRKRRHPQEGDNRPEDTSAWRERQEHVARRLELQAAMESAGDERDPAIFRDVMARFEEFCKTHPSVPRNLRYLIGLHSRLRNQQCLNKFNEERPELYYMYPPTSLLGLRWRDVNDPAAISDAIRGAPSPVQLAWQCCQGLFNNIFRITPEEPPEIVAEDLARVHGVNIGNGGPLSNGDDDGDVRSGGITRSGGDGAPGGSGGMGRAGGSGGM